MKDPSGRNREVLRIFTECGAPEEILYDQKPHLGTDQLIGIVTTMRKKIEEWGGEVRFGAKVTDFGIENGRLTSVTVNETEKIAAETASSSPEAVIAFCRGIRVLCLDNFVAPDRGRAGLYFLM